MPITEGPSTSTKRKADLGDKEEERLEKEEDTDEEASSLPVRTGTGTEPRSPKSALEEETHRSSAPGGSNPGKMTGSGLERERDSESHIEAQSTLPWQRVSVNQEKRGKAGEEETEEEAREEEAGKEAGEVVEKAGEPGVSWDIVITVVAASVSSVFLIFTVSITVLMLMVMLLMTLDITLLCPR